MTVQATRLERVSVYATGNWEQIQTGDVGLRIVALWLVPFEPLPPGLGLVTFRRESTGRIVCTLDVEMGMLFGRRFFNGSGLIDAAQANADHLIEEYQRKLATLRAHAVALDALAEGNLAALAEMRPDLADADLKEWTSSFLLRLQHASPLLHPIDLRPHDVLTVQWWPKTRDLPPLTIAVLSEVPYDD